MQKKDLYRAYLDTPSQISFFENALRKSSELFATKGYSQVGMRELTNYIGVSPGAIYHHVESKESLLFMLIEAVYEDLNDGIGLTPKTRNEAYENLERLVTRHTGMHPERSFDFLVAERDCSNLCEQNITKILQLRLRYERHFESIFYTITGLRSQQSIRLLAKLTVSMLNLAPNWANSKLLETEKNGNLFGI